MHRFYLPPDQCRGAMLALTGSESHHASRVLRVRNGERVTVLDGAGGERICEVAGVDKRSVQLAVLEKKLAAPPSFHIALLQAIPKGRLFESIIQKATELGVARIVPILAERVTMRLDPTEAAEKTEKWRQAAIEAIKQCGSAWLPAVESPLTPQQFLARQESHDLALVGSLHPGARHPRECLREFQMRTASGPRTVAVWIGPEGDFTASELAAIQAATAQPITLGPLVLRTETAAIYCLSFLNYELQRG